MVLMSGTMISQALPLALIPILTRLYTPEDFGVYALYLALLGFFASIISGRYELSIMLPQEESDAEELLWLSLLITLFLSLLLLFGVYFFREGVAEFLGNPEISDWLYFLPLSVFLTGSYQCFKYWCNRSKNYKFIASSAVARSFGSSSVNLAAGLKSFGVLGLIFGNVIGNIVATVILFKKASQSISLSPRKVKLVRLKVQAKKYINFPKFDAPAALVYATYTNMTLIFFNKFFESSVAGFYFMANRLLRLPFSFFISAFTDVFYQRLSNELDKADIPEELNVLTIKLIKVVCFPFFGLVYLSEVYVPILFGDKWFELYKYIAMISLPIFFTLCLSPYSHVLKVYDRQDISLLSHLSKLVILGGFFASYFVFEYSLLVFVFVFTLLDSLLHIALASIVDHTIKNPLAVRMIFFRLSVWLCIGCLNVMYIFK